MIRSMLILAALATALPAQDFNGPLGFQAQPGAGQAPQSAGEDKDYRRGRTALDASR